MSKLVEANKKIEEGVVSGYKMIKKNLEASLNAGKMYIKAV